MIKQYSGKFLVVAIAILSCTGKVDAQVVSGKEWMSELPDELTLGQFSIPGSHDSMSLYDSPVIKDTAKTQSLTLSEQLAAGVRFVDIRARHINNAFVMHHGVVYQKANFNDVMTALTGFLSANRNETVLMSLKEEYKPEGNTETFEETFTAYASKYAGFFYAPGQSILEAPQLGSVRGKIVLVRRFNDTDCAGCPPDMPRGIMWPENVDNQPDPDRVAPYAVGQGTCARIQDHYTLESSGWTNMPLPTMQLKMSLFDGARKEASNFSASQILFNFASGYDTTSVGYPTGIKKLSDYMNSGIYQRMTDRSLPDYDIRATSGVYISDYANVRTASAIWGAVLDKFVQ